MGMILNGIIKIACRLRLFKECEPIVWPNENLLTLDLSANAAEDAMVPYFPQIIEELKKYLNPTETESELKVQLQALG